ncbi:class II aldolase/adducin family protein [Microbacterium sp. SYP-A9085]|jgi:L-fuculose-phosphate aldolase|uniref:class II aldolase/adducin family protein n=1 Tax=Microbacterium sp. SYP-A9085 TaxID=2664454 RepID=UPI00129AEFFC|nr:class II aldolase/adducin family protein [Microbacterium sp. SYP-A9085]MRH27958.1 class II aldolase/adducin family protein [Microbacterium sp. SYP-A9085]
MASDVAPGMLRLLREELVAISRRAYNRGLVPGVSGNNSLRVPGTDLVLIKATSCCQGDMTVQDTVLVTIAGEVLDTGRKPSKEWQFHLGIYRERPDVGGVAHLHPPYSVAFSVAGQVPKLVNAAARGHLRQLGRVDLMPAGSIELADAIIHEFENPEVHGVLMREHGTVTIGPDLRTAYHRTEYLEDNARIAYLAAQIAGVRPAELQLAVDLDPLAEVNDG